MNSIAIILTIFVVVEHCYILWMEMFSWETAGKKTFGKHLPKELFKQTKGLAANQGLYNGFLVGGLIWSFVITDDYWSIHIRMFFLTCVAIAGIYGASTIDKKIFFLQGIPAILALLFTFLTKY